MSELLGIVCKRLMWGSRLAFGGVGCLMRVNYFCGVVKLRWVCSSAILGLSESLLLTFCVSTLSSFALDCLLTAWLWAVEVVRDDLTYLILRLFV